MLTPPAKRKSDKVRRLPTALRLPMARPGFRHFPPKEAPFLEITLAQAFCKRASPTESRALAKQMDADRLWCGASRGARWRRPRRNKAHCYGMVAAVEHRFGPLNRLPVDIEWLRDNGSCYLARTRRFACAAPPQPQRGVQRESTPARDQLDLSQPLGVAASGQAHYVVPLRR